MTQAVKSAVINTSLAEHSHIVKIVEDLGVLAYWLKKSTTRADYLMSFITYAKLYTGESLLIAATAAITDKFNLLFGPEVQGFEDQLDTIRDIFDKYDKIWELPTIKKCYKLTMFCLSFNIFAVTGTSFSSLNYTVVEEEALRRRYNNRSEFMLTIVDTTTFLMKQGFQMYRTGISTTIFHSAEVYSKWIEKAGELERLSLCLSNLEAQGAEYFQYRKDLDDTIESGEAITKYVTKDLGSSINFIKVQLSKLKTLRASEVTKKAAAQNRKAPFSVLVAGGSSVGKSSFTEMLFQFYGKIFDLGTSDDFKYTRNSIDEFWSNFRSHMWCIQLDDIAMMNPEKAQEDASLNDLINVVNNVPYVPNQAALEDKGRTPCLARFVVATTNTPHLNASVYFACPLALRRRLPYVFQIFPKAAYARDDSPQMIDASKLPSAAEQQGVWPNYWNIMVHKIVHAGDKNGRQFGKMELVEKFYDIENFLRYFAKIAKDFERLQAQAVEVSGSMSQIQICKECYSAITSCICAAGNTVGTRQVSGFDFAQECEGATPARPVKITNTAMFTVRHDTPFVPLTLYTPTPEGADVAQKNLRKFVSDLEYLGLVILPHYVCRFVAQYGRDLFAERYTKFLKQYLARTVYFREYPVLVDWFNSPEALKVFKEWSRIGSPAELAHFPVNYFQGRIKVPTLNPSTPDVSYTLDDQDSDSAIADKCWKDFACESLAEVAAWLVFFPCLIWRYFGWNGYCGTFVRGGCTYTIVKMLVLWVGILNFFGLAFLLGVTRQIIVRLLNWFVLSSWGKKTAMALLFDFRNIKITPPKQWKMQISALALLSICWMSYRHYSKITVKEVQDSSVLQEPLPAAPVGTTELPPGPVPTTDEIENEKKFPLSDEVNPWYNASVPVTSFDLDPMHCSMASLQSEQVISMVAKNCVFMETTSLLEDGSTRRNRFRAFCLGGHLYVTNNHNMPNDPSLRVLITRQKQVAPPEKAGVNNNIHFCIQQGDILRMEPNDLAFFQVLGQPPCKDLTSLVAKVSLNARINGFYIARNIDGEATTVELWNCTKVPPADYNFHVPTWTGQPARPTVSGECGSVMLLIHPSYCVIVGIHAVLFHSGHIGAARLDQEVVEMAINHFRRPIIQSGVPKLSCSTAIREVGELHHKSPLRYIEEGAANVFGTFTGFRPHPKSHVAPTLLGEVIMKAKGWEKEFGQPSMHPWKPTRVALQDIFGMSHEFSSVTLAQAKMDFVEDILGQFLNAGDRHGSGDFSYLNPLTHNAAVNGIPGVKYIDHMNFNTSMGAPWGHTKQKHLLPYPTDDCPDNKTFEPEVWERVDEIIARYEACICYHPVFTAHMKDEAKELLKIIAHKTRIFTAAPSDWSIVVRKYLLPFVKLLQENKYVFQAAPGTNAQSLEWEQIREYLTQFGADRIVAGDYAKFDKRMSSEFILAAFDVIIEIHAKAGWSEKELRVLYGIAEDTAFPLVDFRGDLIQFYGSNPSGHPLTVIINSLVNILYLRYCYIVLNPDHESATFTMNVAAMTYGDDNIMGVSKRAPWFNHTALVEVLKSIGVGYTMADKTAVSVPYISLSETSFLKREWRWDQDVGAYLAPLADQSIRKMLTIGLVSKDISREEGMLAVMQSALNEYFFHGKARFEEERIFLQNLVVEHDLERFEAIKPLPTWFGCYERFWKNSLGVKIQREHINPMRISTTVLDDGGNTTV